VLLVPELWLDQVLPPFVVTRMVPESPTAQQLLVLGQVTA
jgi:hypothetical protein